MSDDVIVETRGSLGRIRLNRPKALNALTLGMIREIDAALDRFAADGAVASVAISGEGERGLCAGGDLRGFYESEGPGFAETFWREEYRLNARIARFEKPVIALMDGIVMGGGVGISAHARRRIVTERSKIAMPETGIGLFPDVGASWLLPRAPGETGTWLGLMGEAIGAADAIYSRLADAYVPSPALAGLIDALAALPTRAGDDEVGAAIEAVAEAPGPGLLEALRPAIDRCFAFDTAPEIVAALDAQNSDFGARTRETLMRRSPTGLAATLALLRLGRSAPSLEACLERELQAALALFGEHDFREGVRALLIDKDRNPRWRPAALDAVSPAQIEAWLRPRVPPIFAEAVA